MCVCISHLMDWDEVICYEEQCYQTGLKQGADAAATQLNEAGYSAGIKIGFEKYLALGILQSRTECWKIDSGVINNPRDVKTIETLTTLTESGSMVNDPEEVEQLGRRKKISTNKIKLLAQKTKKPQLNLHEDLTGIIKTNADRSSIEDIF